MRFEWTPREPERKRISWTENPDAHTEPTADPTDRPPMAEQNTHFASEEADHHSAESPSHPVVPEPTHYETLEVSPNASPEVIKAARKALTLKHHPDVDQTNREESEEKMARINIAYAVLSDEERRRLYDGELRKST